MDPLSTFTTFSLIISSILTLVCTQQVLITPIQCKTNRPLLIIRILNVLFGSTETVYILLCLIEHENAKTIATLSEARFIFDMIRYLFLSFALLIFILDRLQYLYRIHVNEAVPLWIDTIYITLCCIFNITLIITFSVALYSTSSFYWKIQLIHLKLDVFLSCVVAIIAICHIYYKFNHKISSYLDTILSQHNQLKEIENINKKLFDSNYMFQLTQGLGVKHYSQNMDNNKVTKEDVLANNLNLAAKIREANHKLVSYIVLLMICAIIDCVYIPVSISRISSPSHMHILTAPHVLTSNLEFILQRILFSALLILLIYYVYDEHSLFKILYYKNNKQQQHAQHHKVCIISCLNGSLFVILFREIYLLIMYLMSNVCPCWMTHNCVNLRQHIYDIKKYERYFGHLPKTKHNKFVMIPGGEHKHELSEIEESLPNHNSAYVQTPQQQYRNRSQSHVIFNSPPIVKERRMSQVSICGVVQNKDDTMKDDEHHRKQSTIFEYDSLSVSEHSQRSNSPESCDDLQVGQLIIDEDGDKDIVDFDDTKSEQYDNFAEIMIQRERDYYSNHKDSPCSIIDDKNRRQSLEITQDNHARGSIGNLGKKRRKSLILNAVDAFKMTIHKNINYKEKKQQTKESYKEALFVQSAKNKIDPLDIHNDDDTDDVIDDEDEKEYYNTQTSHTQTLHKRSTDRLSSVRNSIKSMIGIKSKKKNKDKIDRGKYEPFEYATDTMIFHKAKNENDTLFVRQEFTTDTDEEDNISLATYATAKDCLDDDFESELNMLAMKNQSVSPNRSLMSGNDERFNESENESARAQFIVNNTSDDNDDESFSLESISRSEDEEETSPAPPRMVKISANQKNIKRNRKQSVPLAQIQELDVASSLSSSARNDLDVTINISDFSDDMLSEAML